MSSNTFSQAEMLLVICLSVCLSHSLPRIPFVYTVLERRSSSDFMGILLLALVNGDVILTEIKNSNETKMQKLRICSWKSEWIYFKPIRPT